MPHQGYRVLNSWCDILPRLNLHSGDKPNPFHVYTSNVDGHFRRYSKLAGHLTEIHGCCEESVCSSSIGYYTAHNPISDGLCGQSHSEVVEERVGDTFRDWNDRATDEDRKQCRQVIQETPRRAPRTAPDAGGLEENASVPMCPVCRKFPLRPLVVMFGDSCPNVIPKVRSSTDAYQRWEDAMEADIARTSRTGRKPLLVILELGCGLRVPSVRIEVEDVLRDVSSCQPSPEPSPGEIIDVSNLFICNLYIHQVQTNVGRY